MTEKLEIRQSVGLEILKLSPSLSGNEVVAVSAGTSFEDLMIINSNDSLFGQSIWLVFDADQKLYVAKQEAKQQNISTLLPPAFRQTHFAFYRQRLGERRNEYPTVDDKRTVWIPVDGFFAGVWHDGPLVVTERDGTISNLIPTGTEASLLLAPDDTQATGRDQIDALGIEGSASDILYRGSVAAARQKLRLWPADSVSVVVKDPSLTSLVQLATMRAAMGPHQRLAVQLAKSEDDKSPPKIDPRFRRFCENSGIGPDNWSEPLCELETFFSWMNQRWIDDLVTVINRHGSIIPG